ncbi:MAG: hypothetical protein DWH74_01815, partial [Planctomycetota bacterium]
MFARGTLVGINPRGRRPRARLGAHARGLGPHCAGDQSRPTASKGCCRMGKSRIGIAIGSGDEQASA